MKKEPYHFDELQHNKEVKVLEAAVPIIQLVIDAYYKIEGIPAIEPSELPTIFNDTDKFLCKKIIAMYGVNFNGLELKEDKLFEMFKKPDGVDDFLNEVLTAKELFKQKPHGNTFNVHIESFVLTDTTVSIKPLRLAEIKVANSRYFQNDKQERVHSLMTDIAEKYNTLQQVMGGSLEVKTLFGEGFELPYTDLSANKRQAKINPNYIARI